MKKFNEIDVLKLLRRIFPQFEDFEVTKNENKYTVVEMDEMLQNIKSYAMDFALPFEHIEVNNGVLTLSGEVRMCFKQQLLIEVDEVELVEFISTQTPTHYVENIVEKNKFIQTLDYDVRKEIKCKVFSEEEFDDEFEHNSIFVYLKGDEVIAIDNYDRNIMWIK